MNILKKTVTILTLVVFASGLFLPTPLLALSSNASEACEGLELTGAECTSDDSEVNTVLTTVINIFSLVVGVVSVIMIIVGGLRYITSGGDAGNTKGAKDTILYAIIGLVIVAMAQIIVRFVLTQFK